MSMAILDGPTPNLGTVEFEGMQAPGFGSDKAVGTGRSAAKAFFKEVQNWLGPSKSMIPAGAARRPHAGRFVRARFEVFGTEGVETTTGNFELVGSFDGAEPQFPKTIQNVTNEGRRMSMKQLLVLFKKADSTRAASRASHFVGLRYAPASSMTGPWGPPIDVHLSCFANYRNCPVLLAPRQQIPLG
jgi:hypothetical protein